MVKIVGMPHTLDTIRVEVPHTSTHPEVSIKSVLNKQEKIHHNLARELASLNPILITPTIWRPEEYTIALHQNKPEILDFLSKLLIGIYDKEYLTRQLEKSLSPLYLQLVTIRQVLTTDIIRGGPDGDIAQAKSDGDIVDEIGELRKKVMKDSELSISTLLNIKRIDS